jgi:hypothetical protein
MHGNPPIPNLVLHTPTPRVQPRNFSSKRCPCDVAFHSLHSHPSTSSLAHCTYSCATRQLGASSISFIDCRIRRVYVDTTAHRGRGYFAQRGACSPCDARRRNVDEGVSRAPWYRQTKHADSRQERGRQPRFVRPWIVGGISRVAYGLSHGASGRVRGWQGLGARRYLNLLSSLCFMASSNVQRGWTGLSPAGLS